jgi:hypothetical protein
LRGQKFIYSCSQTVKTTISKEINWAEHEYRGKMNIFPLNYRYFGASAYNAEDFKSIRISDTLDYQSAILSFFAIERILKVSGFLILWTTSFCSFKYISHIMDLKSIRISGTLDYRSAILNIFDIQYRGFHKYQNF